MTSRPLMVSSCGAIAYRSWTYLSSTAFVGGVREGFVSDRVEVRGSSLARIVTMAQKRHHCSLFFGSLLARRCVPNPHRIHFTDPA